MFYYIKSDYTILHHITLFYIISYRVIFCYITSYHTISHHIISYHIMSYHITSHHTISYHIYIIYIYIISAFCRKKNVSPPFPLQRLPAPTDAHPPLHLKAAWRPQHQHLPAMRVECISYLKTGGVFPSSCVRLLKDIHFRELTYPTLGKGTSSSKVPFFGGIC